MKIDSSIAAVVTGGASGLGRASAEALAAAGAKVAIFDINEAQGEEIAAKIGGIFCKVDITSEESVVAGFEKGARCTWAGTHPRPLRDDIQARQDAVL